MVTFCTYPLYVAYICLVHVFCFLEARPVLLLSFARVFAIVPRGNGSKRLVCEQHLFQLFGGVTRLSVHSPLTTFALGTMDAARCSANRYSRATAVKLSTQVK